MGVAYSAPLCLSAARAQLLLIRHPQKLVTDWVGPSRNAHAMPGYYSQTQQHSTNEGVQLSNSACSMLMSDGLWLPKRGIEPGPSGFWDIGSTARPLPLPSIGSTWIAVSWTLYYYIRSFARSFMYFIFSEKNAFFNVLYSYCSRSLHLWTRFLNWHMSAPSIATSKTDTTKSPLKGMG